ncbi:MAG: hypothetical protein CMB65_05690 [Euryarchaeota archaeon]|nr:hypothetical protein [Euryarchaeota archaeon]
MGRHGAVIVVVTLLALSWSATIPAVASDSRSNEGGSILFEKRIFASNEPLDATVGLWGLTLGRSYELHWMVHATNISDDIGLSTMVSSGTLPFFANQSAMQLELNEYHVANESMMYFLEIGLNSTAGWTNVSAIEPFSVFRNSMSPQYSEMFIFGDSLSDSGNTYSAFGTPESPPYWQGRYSNGKNWVDFTGDWVGFSNVAGRGGSTGNNRAFGGAATGNGLQFLVIENIGKQVDDWDQNNNLGPSDAVAIWGGGNDLINYGATNTQNLVDNLEEHAEQLIAAGGQELIFFELPPLEKTPGESGSSEEDRQALGQRVSDFNAEMATMVSNLNSTYGVVTHLIPIWIGFEMLYWSGEHFGITNVTHSACEHDGATCDSNDPIAPNVDEYIFFDNLHPTETTHNAVALFLRQVVGIPDYDGDNVADEFDLCPYTLPGILVSTDGCEIPPPDSDEDGVIDEVDECPGTDPELSVDEVGCATNQIDSDVDGVFDDVDLCPDTQPGWQVNSVGCSEWELDTDDDGIVDAQDDCQGTDLDEEIDEDGCSDSQKDSDSDGVTDDLDACPSTPREELVNKVGCSASQLDDDTDGVFNSQDVCPDTPQGAKDVNLQGCGPSQRDSDEDGVSDNLDLCPETEWLDEIDIYGCAANQRDTDKDGRKDSVDGCPLIWGSLNGCPVLTVELELVVTPDSISRTANVSITITCESGCLMDWNIAEPLIVADGSNARNGTFFATYTNVEDEIKQLTARVSIDGMWKEVPITIYFPPIVDDSNPVNETDGTVENTDSDQQGGGDEQNQGLALDSDSVAILALLLLLNIGVVAAIIVIRSRSRQNQDHRQRAMAAFERSLFEEDGAMTSPSPTENQEFSIESIPQLIEQNPERMEEKTSIDLPNIGDLID